MSSSSEPCLAQWITRLQAIAQNGLAYSRDSYDIERYHALRQIVAEMLAHGSSLDIEAARMVVNRDTGHATPKVDVRGVVFRDDQLLLVRERSDGRWTLPGGWADVCTSPAENVVREVFEESGFQTRVTKLLSVFDRGLHPHHPPFPFHVYKLFLRCEIVGGTENTSIETDAVAFFSEDALPELSIDRVTPGQISRMFEHLRDPKLPADFDPISAGG